MTTPTAMSPGATSVCVPARDARGPVRGSDELSHQKDRLSFCTTILAHTAGLLHRDRINNVQCLRRERTTIETRHPNSASDASRKTILRFLLLLRLLAGCDMVVLRPPATSPRSKAQLIVISTVLMLLIIVPVIALTLVFAWRYRESNTRRTYYAGLGPFHPAGMLIWAAPLLIIIALGALTWIGTHTLDPYRPLTGSMPPPVPAGTKPLIVEVVALDWKWLFIYPDHGIAVVNELAAPVDMPIRFKITASSVMNSFFIPALAGQIYAMPSMETKLHAVINRPGEYEGFSANYSGAGFSDMRFKFHGLTAADFDRWVQRVKAERRRAEPRRLSEARAAKRARAGAPLSPASHPTCSTPSSIAASTPGKMCMRQIDGHRRARRRRRCRARSTCRTGCRDAVAPGSHAHARRAVCQRRSAPQTIASAARHCCRSSTNRD